MSPRPEYCGARSEEEDPVCPACGATVEGDDPVNGVCQARNPRPAPEPYLSLVLLDKETGEIVASTSAYI
jgi:predicted amidophosphoribosyltransferase